MVLESEEAIQYTIVYIFRFRRMEDLFKVGGTGDGACRWKGILLRRATTGAECSKEKKDGRCNKDTGSHTRSEHVDRDHK